jgi:hypothetical protein
MKPLFILSFCLLFLVACKNKNENSADKIQTPESANKPEQKKEESPAVNMTEISQEELAAIDMGAYIFRVHDVLQYKPGEMQAKLMKLDDATKDYLIVDCSIESNAATETDTGRDLLSTYFTLGDGSAVKYNLSWSSILGSYHAENRPRFPQQQYDLMWSSKFPAGATARRHLFAIEVPQGATLSGVGFYKDNPAKNKYSKLRN